MLKALALAVLASAVLASVARAGETNSASGLVVRVDWQRPEQLPPRFRNHCTLENFTSRPYCSDHCGIDYQFYYCSEASAVTSATAIATGTACCAAIPDAPIAVRPANSRWPRHRRDCFPNCCAFPFELSEKRRAESASLHYVVSRIFQI